MRLADRVADADAATDFRIDVTERKVVNIFPGIFAHTNYFAGGAVGAQLFTLPIKLVGGHSK
jgi:hypothetical protein